MLDNVVYNDVTVFDLIMAVIIILLAVLISKIITINARRALRDDLDPGKLRILTKVINFIVIIFALIIIVPMLGIDWQGLLIAGGIIGLVLAFALQNIISNFIAGFFLMVERPFKIGDVVDVDGKEGTVEDIKIFSTHIRGYDGYVFRIPNDRVFTTKLTNFSNTMARRFEYTIGIGYRNDAKKALQIINSLIEEHPFILKNPPHQAFVDKFADSSVNIILRVWAPVQVWYNVKMELLAKIKIALMENGIEIPFPQRTIWFGNKPELDAEKQ